MRHANLTTVRPSGAAIFGWLVGASLLFAFSGCNEDDEQYKEVTLDDVAKAEAAAEENGHDHSSHAHSSHGGDDHAAHSDEHEHEGHNHESHGSATSKANKPSKPPKTTGLLIGYCVLIVGGSLLGGWLPNLVNLTHARMQFLVCLVGGLMLGIGVFHLLPHGWAAIGSVDLAVKWMMAGILVMFFLLKMFHFHQHAPVEPHDHDHGHHDAHDHGSHRLSWLGVFFGLALHTLIDGMALGASIRADAEHGAMWGLFGLGTFFAILLHKPLDAVSITSLMVAGGWSSTWRNIVNASFAAMCPLGAVAFQFGVDQFSDNQHVIVGCALTFSGGVFICISLGDLLPEVHFEAARIKLSAALIAGVLIAWGIGFLEPEHAHSHDKGAAGDSHDEGGSGHSSHGDHNH
ncbi:MAG: iron permease [Planctomycetaceae bacterium]|nr:iron permease [Planctomycetaceae bacterium]